jgi:hypothetical protein
MFEVTEKAKEMVREFLKSRNRLSSIRILPWTGE